MLATSSADLRHVKTFHGHLRMFVGKLENEVLAVQPKRAFGVHGQRPKLLLHDGFQPAVCAFSLSPGHYCHRLDQVSTAPDTRRLDTSDSGH